MIALFAATTFTSATLLFLLQPMFARMVLPLLGGSPSVWNTAMVFYQAVLLAGYGCAHASTKRLRPHQHIALQVLLLMLPLAVLPIAVPGGWTPPTDANPLPWLLALMSVAVGLPFFVVSTMSPVLQHWFSATGHARAADPYFLYSASNLGSMLALLSYPILLEPHLSHAQQAQVWSWGYALLIVLAFGCAFCVWQTAKGARTLSVAAEPPNPKGEKIPLRRRGRWLLLAFLPSSLMLGTTTYLSSDIAVVPLFWILPLALYLLTFILAFARKQRISPTLLARAWPIACVALLLAFNVQAALPVWLVFPLHLAGFFIAALLCQLELAADRPPAGQLTEFYLWLAFGGVLGGVFNALIAPLIFRSVAEYPLVFLLVAFAAPGIAAAQRRLLPVRTGDWLPATVLAVVTIALGRVLDATPLRGNNAVGFLLFGIPATLCFFLSRRPLRFALGAAAVLLAGTFYLGEKGRVLHGERSFFGVHRVTVDPTGEYHTLIHGVTLHGMQSLDPERRRESLTYYHRTGPIGDVLAAYGRAPTQNMGVVGLGVGSLASFAQPRQSWTFFEIDPVVERLAREARYFTFLRDSQADLRVVLGDARLSLARAEPQRFDVLVLDAFSSDAIPVHLITREALALYRRHLAPRGVLAFHISNLHLDLEPVLANLARDASLACLVCDDTGVSPEEQARGKSPSIWLVMAENAADLAPLVACSRWQPPRTDDRPVWTDDYSSLLSIFRWQ